MKRCFLQVQAYRTAHYLITHFEFGKKICQILPDSRPPRIPENEGSSPKISMIFFEELFGEAGFSPPPVFLCEAQNFENSFLAAPTIPRHFSLTSLTLHKQTPKEFTFAAISSHTFVLFLFVSVEVNLLLLRFFKDYRAFSSCKVRFPVSLIFSHCFYPCARGPRARTRR